MGAKLYEIEQKHRRPPDDLLEASWRRWGAVFRAPIFQSDLYFAHPCRDFATTDEALRIRRVGEAAVVTYKGPKLGGKAKTRRELEIPLAGGGAGAAEHAELLLALGFRRVAEVRKTRRPGELTWRGERIELALDDVEGVGAFLEIELVTEAAAREQAEDLLQSLAAELGLGEQERRSYLELLLEGRASGGEGGAA